MPDDTAPDGFNEIDAGPFLDHVGPVLASPGGDVLALRVGPRHLNQGGSAHGGLLASLVDSAMGRAVRAESGTDAVATVSLTTDFLGPVKEGELIEARTKVERTGGNLAFVDCSLRAGDREVVRGRAVFALLD